MRRLCGSLSLLFVSHVFLDISGGVEEKCKDSSPLWKREIHKYFVRRGIWIVSEFVTQLHLTPCPHCGGERVLAVGTPMMSVANRALTTWRGVPRSNLDAVVCTHCGYTILYARNPSKLKGWWYRVEPIVLLAYPPVIFSPPTPLGWTHWPTSMSETMTNGS